MKKLFLIILLIIAACAVSFARKFVAAGQSYTALGDYKIEIPDNPMFLNGKELQTFVISYANSKMEVTIAIVTEKKQKKYLVLSDALSIQYTCNGDYFGVRLIDDSFRKFGYKTSPSALNLFAYQTQKVISTGESCKLDHAKLIAAYFPMLINNFENIISESKLSLR